jgi:D-alanyl-D-alanine dipeptidase
MMARLTAFFLLVSVPAPAAAQHSVPASPAALVDIRSADSTIRVTTRETTLARREVADRLARVAHRLATGAVGLKLYSGYRLGPGGHAEGMAVDLTLVDLSRGTGIPMGSSYPESDTAMAPAPVGGRRGIASC